MAVVRVAPALMLATVAACATAPDQPAIRTLEPGVVKIAVTSTSVTDPLDPEEWMYRYAERLARDLGLRADWHVVPFDKSWELAGKDVVDVVATNLASFPDRVSPGGTFSAPFLYEQRALRIRAADRARYRTIADFVGGKVGAVKGMAAERDLLRRAPEGVEIVSTTTFLELYERFGRGELDAVAQAEYFALDGRVIPSYGPDIALIDHHDLHPGQREESVFVVRDRSTGLLEAVNAFVARTPFPLHLARVDAAPPALLQSARQLVLVVTPDWDTVRGDLRRFERAAPGQPWRPVGAAAPVVVGRNGTAWDPLVSPVVTGPQKAEGDGRSPAGVFRLGTAFGYAPPAEASWLKLAYLSVVDGTECVDDVASSVYNQIVDRGKIEKPDWTSSEKMREVGEAYRWGVVVDYNTPAVAGRGSCIFLHIGGEGGRGTAGCTAMPADVLREVMAWLDPAASPVLVQLPRAARDALERTWALP